MVKLDNLMENLPRKLNIRKIEQEKFKLIVFGFRWVLMFWEGKIGQVLIWTLTVFKS